MVISNFKVGIVGLGYWGKNQARVFDELGCLEGVYDPQVSRNKETNHYRFYDSLDQLIDNIDDLKLTFLYENAWHESWPISLITSKKIPTLIKIEFSKQNKDYSWIIDPNISYAIQN